MQNKFVLFNSVILYLLPIFIITGPFLADLSVSIIALSFIFLTFKYKLYSYYNNKIVIIFFVWCALLIITSLISTHKYLSLESSLFYFRFGLFSICVWYIIENNKNFLIIFFYFLFVSFIIVLIDAYIQFFLGKNLLGYPYIDERLGGLFRDEKILGAYVVRMLPIIFALLTLSFIREKYRIYIFFIFLILSDVIIFLSGERSAFVYLILSTFYILLLINRYRLLRLVTITLSFLILSLITVSNDDVRNRMIEQTLTQTQILEEDKKIFSSQHEAFYKTGMKMFFDNPVTGVGLKIYRHRCGEDKYYVKHGCTTHPHNTYVQILAETGILGFLPFMTFFIFFVYESILQFHSIWVKKRPYLSDYQVCMYAGVLISLWPIIPTTFFFHNWNSVIIFLPIGFLLASYNRNKKNNV